ncbi:CLUMA_CG007976, isoform A [Clunio marinus]|uniref:CLUMA_CG007976, isoform A n=1 Tax=Clunio marinus TaxID=568069 RepID=A0A1J1I6A9_9DIPT|nr:CLUMA_CG007976, isoform A [Clunio marinus]
MATEVTPLLVKHIDEIVVVIPKEKIIEYDDENNSNEVQSTLTYEELIPFILDPSWIRLRRICFSSFWIFFFVILLAACISSYMSMSTMTCGMTSIVTKADNTSIEHDNVMNVQGILSSPFNDTP